MNSNPWFRMYAEFANDAKVQSMPECMQRRLMMLFCLRCSDVLVTLGESEIAFALRISEQELSETKALFLRKNFIDERWQILNWDKRQFVSDSSTERTRAYRERRRTSRERHGNALDTDTDTDTDTEKIQKRTEANSETEADTFASSCGHAIGSEGWAEICEAAARAGMSFDPSPDSDFCMKVWCKLDMETKLEIIDSIRKRIEAGQFGPDVDPRYIPRLDNYVVKKKYRESIQARGNVQVIAATGRFASLRAAASSENGSSGVERKAS